MALRFFFRSILWALPIALGLAIYILLNSAYIPAPKLSSNLALNEQLRRIIALHEPNVEVLAMGSSMTLNNLASAPVVKHYGTTSYENSGAWGMGVKEIMSIAAPLLDRFSPKQVIMVTNLMDFQPGANITTQEAEAVREYLQDGGTIRDYFRYWDAAFFLRQMDLNRIRFRDEGNYEFLGFDKHGAATLEVPAERILPSRYNAQPPKAEDLDASFYEAFASFSAMLRERQVKLLVIQSPYREGLMTPTVQELISQHSSKLRAILEPNGHRLVDSNIILWPDSLFNDANHLDHVGAHALTQWALGQQVD